MRQAQLEKEWQKLLKQTPGMKEYSDAFNQRAREQVLRLGNLSSPDSLKFERNLGNEFLIQQRNDYQLKSFFFWVAQDVTDKTNSKKAYQLSLCAALLGGAFTTGGGVIFLATSSYLLAGLSLLAGGLLSVASIQDHKRAKIPVDFAKRVISIDQKQYAIYKAEQTQEGIAESAQQLLPHNGPRARDTIKPSLRYRFLLG